MMSEQFELHSFSKKDGDSDIEEYHEINQEGVHETVFSQELSSPVKEYDFFTQYDAKPSLKSSQRKKKKSNPKRDKETSLMDVIKTELASAAVPISENIITIMDNEEKERNYSFLVRSPSRQSLFRKNKPFRLDSEYGWGHRQNSIYLSPIFPRVLENAIPVEQSIPVQYVDPVQFSDLASEYSNNDKLGDKFLDISIKDIRFTHHHMFSLETMLCSKLVESYNEYIESQRKLEDLVKDVRVNRETRDKLKQDFMIISPNKTEDIRFDQTVRKYTGQLLQLKKEYRDTLRTQRKIIHKTISLWSDIEMVREKFGHTLTPYVLDIINKDMDDKKFEEEWTEAYNLEFSDMLDKIDYEFVTKYIEYKEIKHDENSDSFNKRKVNKPKLKVDEQALKEKVEEIVNDTLNCVKIDMILKKDPRILSDGAGNDTSKLNYQFDIYVDEVFVCRSEIYNSVNESLFEVQFLELFSVQILPKNEILTIIFLENNEEVSACNIFLNEIKENYSNADFIDHTFVYKNLTIHPDHKYVGSGHNIKTIAKGNKVRLKTSNLFEGDLQTACNVSLKMGWNEKLYQQDQSETIKESMEVGRKLKRLMHGIDRPNVDTLKDLIGKIYGKDIGNNDKVVKVLQNICKTKVKSNHEFPVDENDAEFVRLKLLHLRNMGGFTNIEDKLVPLHASQISTEQLNCLQRSNDKEIDVEYISDKYGQMDPIELQRFVGSKYVEKLNQNIQKNLHEHLMKKTQKDVVRDYRELSLRSLFSNQTSIGTIAALPRSTKQQYLNVSIGQEQEIHLTVLRAFNLMDRSSIILSDDNEDDECTIAGFKVRPLRPFIRLSYRGISTNTATAIGCHPTWNQTVNIKTKLQPLSSLHIDIFDEYKANINEGNSDDDNTSHGKTVHYRYSNRWLGTVQVPMHAVLNLGVLRGTFKISTPPLYFGYEVIQNKDSSQSLIPEVTQLLRKESAFMSLQIATSLSHLGGLQGYNQPIPSSADDDNLIKHLNATVTDYTNDFPMRNIKLTFIDSSGRNKCVTQFLQPIALPNYEFSPKHPKSLRADSALSKSSGVSKSSSSKSSGGRRRSDDLDKGYSPGREESLYSGHDSSWKGDSQMVKMMNACLRYVSLIPIYEETESHVVTLMGVELLKVLIGSPLDHTILLTSYFLYLGIKCWVVIGQGLPRGQSSYVLTQYDLVTRREVLVTDQLFKKGGFLNRIDGYLWNVYDATNGERFELRDVSCPLKTVDYVFDNENIWLNVQSTQGCAGVSFDFTKSSNWLPVFNRTIFVMKLPMVNEASLYSPPADVTALRESLEAKIKAKVQKWRPQLKTIWNRYCSTLLREVLPYWEYWTFNPSEPRPGFSQRLKQLMVTYRVFGFPLNMPFTRISSVVAAVKATALHASDDPDAEFALAVQVYAYPNNVISVWVFLATISRI